MRRPKFEIGSRVARAELEPMEVDMLLPKMRQAYGKVQRAWMKSYRDRDGFYWMYEVLWNWPNGETCIGQYREHQLSNPSISVEEL